MLNLGIVESLDDLRRLEPEWDGLLAKSSENNVFLTNCWIASWWEAFGQGSSLHVLTLRDGEGALLAVAPMMKSRVRRSGIPATVYRFIYNDNASRANFIIRQGAERLCLHAFMAHFAGLGSWDLLEFPCLHKGSPVYPVLTGVLEELGALYAAQRWLCSPYIDLRSFSDWKNYLATRSHRFRRHIKQWSSLEAKTFTCEEITDTRPAPEALDILRSVSARSWKSRRGKHIDAEPATRRFYEVLCDAASAKGWLHLGILRVDGKPVATDLQLSREGCVSGLRCDFDESYRKSSPGCVLQTRVMRRNIEQGCFEYDFCGDNDPYKAQWVDNVREHVNLSVYNTSFAGRACFAWDHLVVYRMREQLRRLPALVKIKRILTRGKA